MSLSQIAQMPPPHSAEGMQCRHLSPLKIGPREVGQAWLPAQRGLSSRSIRWADGRCFVLLGTTGMRGSQALETCLAMNPPLRSILFYRLGLSKFSLRD